MSTGGRLGRRAVLAVVFGAVVAATHSAIPSSAFAVDCVRADRFVVGSDSPFELRGGRSVINVNDFEEPQCDTTRSIVLWKDASNGLEVGWFKTLGDPPEVLYVNFRDGFLIPNYNTGITPPRGSDRTFKAEDANADRDWGVFYEGSRIDTVTTNFSRATAILTNSEKEYSQDSLRAHFYRIQECFLLQCPSYRDPQNLQRNSNNTADWHFCKISNTEHFVKNQC